MHLSELYPEVVWRHAKPEDEAEPPEEGLVDMRLVVRMTIPRKLSMWWRRTATSMLSYKLKELLHLLLHLRYVPAKVLLHP